MGKNKKKKSHLPLRMNILFFVIFLLFASLILQLGVVQILYGEDAQEEINRTENTTIHTPVPRGKMFDRYGRVIVDNEPLYSITYTPPKGVQPMDRLALAEDLAEFISMGDEEELKKIVRERDLKEYFYLLNEEEVRERVSQEETEDLSGGEEYQLMLDRITEEEIDSIPFEKYQLIAIKKELDQASALAPHIIKNEDITIEEYASVAEHLNQLPGINVTSDWNRKYPYEGTFRNYIGSITNAEQGIPRANQDYYLSLDYSRNDRVGKSGLEEKYESILRGSKEKIRYETDKRNNIVNTEVVREGSRGDDLVLSIDIELQQQVDEIVKKRLKEEIARQPYKNRFLEDAMVVMMDPNTGEVLAVSGMYYNRDRESGEPEVVDHSYKAIQAQHLPGSTVKGATVLMALQEGVMKPGETIYDRTLRIKGTKDKSSYRNLGPVSDVTALQKSSNVYMFLAGIRIGGDTYIPNEPLGFKSGTYEKFLYYFNQFGLGVSTGIDMPSEAVGVVGQNPGPGTQIDLLIGQYNSYTTMQLAQYVSTIANDGYRVRPHLVKEIREPSNDTEQLGPVRENINTTVLNRIEMDQEYIDRVKLGFQYVFQKQGGTAYGSYNDVDYSPAGKTGTAENIVVEEGINGEKELIDTENLTMVGYAPHDNPEVAFSVVVPNVGKGVSSSINKDITKDILDAYFELKKERSEKGIEDVNENLNEEEAEVSDNYEE
ncbi:penicillin-binding protein [Thalassobacillus devorans]|uniref:serine-type D-Ala-D-Ala carboxypeptidase n=1 Tax=Thalassobacillus devorans TaxID=279813 RepID=A0ABQ1P7G5_9BACI|nr:penicillin-binding protein 2 [Thalassobacillus devorans]NIK29661.1 cell division protein FtsI/penicillin-binding protein 2 [Thalassobacillus devorans]GGC91829.1 penicillin-binding protein [Thalassobacillus devorans]